MEVEIVWGGGSVVGGIVGGGSVRWRKCVVEGV